MAIRERGETRAIVRRSFLISATSLAIAGCAGSSSVDFKDSGFVEHSVRTVAIAAPDDLFDTVDTQLAQKIGSTLAKQGFVVDDATRTTAMLAKSNVNPPDILMPNGLRALRSDGVDVVLSVNAAAASLGGPPMRFVKVRLISTDTGKEVVGIDWKNSWAGMPGSPADYMNRKGLDSAAEEIAAKLLKLLG